MTGQAGTHQGDHGDGQVPYVQWGDKVRVDFMAWLEDGTLIDSSIHREPVIFTTGSHTVLKGIEMLVIGMRVGESKTEKIPPDSSYGPYLPELTCEVSRNWLRAQHVEPLIGLGLEVRKTDGTLVDMHITGLDEDRVILDANHRLAGKSLMLQVDLVEIIDQGGLDLSARPTSAA
ncbi:MAG TPA: FKBP-type peptidyl-prolyl cis-trans isomerase [Nitrospira sp.]